MAIASLFASLGYYPKAHRAIIRHRLWPYMILPGLMSLGFFFTLIGLGNAYFSDISATIYQNYFPGFLKWGILLTIMNLLLWILLFLTGYILYQPVVLILFSPVLGLLSEMTERKVCGSASGAFHFGQILKDVLRGVVMSLRNLGRMMLWILLAWLMIFIPIAGAAVSAVLIFLIQAYYNGCALSEYTLERKNYSVKERIRFTRTHRARITGLGMGFMFVLFIPILGWFVAPALGTVAATLATLAAMNENGGPSSAEEGPPAAFTGCPHA
ncbi:EI24 domain-containing protein [Desulfococcus sp.]|uniref:EI24 domain-containing protein n=1 Tax=Desulfococcus sp. TaxID=2025834 RepID=UPI0035936D2A